MNTVSVSAAQDITLNAARDLGFSIMRTPEYKAYKACEARMKENATIQDDVDRLNSMTDELENSNTEMDESEVLTAFNAFWEKLDDNPVVDEFMEARSGLIQLLAEIRGMLSVQLEMDVTQLMMTPTQEMQEEMMPPELE